MCIHNIHNLFKSTISIAALILIGLSSAQAQELPEQIAYEFFKQFQGGAIDQAFDRLLKGSSLEKTDPMGVMRIRNEIKSMATAFGKMVDSELIEKTPIGRRSVKLVYLQNLQLRPLTWIFYFYNTENRWTLTLFTYNGQYQY